MDLKLKNEQDRKVLVGDDVTVSREAREILK